MDMDESNQVVIERVIVLSWQEDDDGLLVSKLVKK